MYFVAATGCTGSPLARLKAPEQLTLFSIDGRDVDAWAERRRGHGVPQAVGQFHGYPVLGSVEIMNSEERQLLIAALKQSVAAGGQVAECFWPRHGLRVVENGQTVEYLICFECTAFEEFVGDKKLRYAGISPDSRPTFDQPLKRAGVPIAPG
jgi:hypothetical protein